MPIDPEELKSISEQVGRAARASESQVSRMRDAMKRAGRSAEDMGRSLEVAVRNYENALRTGVGDTEKLRNVIRAIREAAPDAFNIAADAAERYGELSRRAFEDSVSGSAAMTERVHGLVVAYQKLHGLTKEQAKARLATDLGTRGAAGIYHAEGVHGAIQQDRLAKSAMRAEGISTIGISRRIAESRIIERRATLQAAGATAIGAERLKKSAAESVPGLHKMLGPGPIGAAAQMAVESRTKVGSALRGIMLSEKAALKGVAPTAISGGISVALGSLASALGPLMGAMKGFSLFGQLIIGIFEGMSNASKVAGNQMRAMAMNTSVSMGQFNIEQMDSAARISRMVAGTSLTGLRFQQTFDKEILPAAQRALLGINSFDRAVSEEGPAGMKKSQIAVDEWAAGLSRAAIEGATIGQDYEKSMSMYSRAAKLFGGGSRDAGRTFREMILSIKGTSLTVDQLSESLGNLDDWGRLFGTRGRGVFSEIGLRARLGQGLSPTQVGMVGGAISGLAMDMPRMLGLTTAVQGDAAIPKYVRAARAENAGRAMLDLSAASIRGVLTGAGQGFGPGGAVGALRGGDEQRALEAAMFAAGTILNDVNKAAFFLDPKNLNAMLEMTRADIDPTRRAALQKEIEDKTGDLQDKGMRSILEQTPILAQMLTILTYVGNVIGKFSVAGRAAEHYGGLKPPEFGATQSTQPQSVGRIDVGR
jgi:hypothetical protein